jgi:hypothetical protein
MTTKQYWLLCILGAVCVLLAIEKYRVTQKLDQTQQHVNELQAAINGGTVNRLGPKAIEAVLVDMASMSATNAQLRKLLGDHGYTVNYDNPPVTNAPNGALTNSTEAATNNSTTTNSPSH